MTTARRVVVTSIGAITNVGSDAASSWDALVRGRSGITPITSDPFRAFRDDQWAVKIAGSIPDSVIPDYLTTRETKRLDRFAILGISAGIEAVNNSGLDFSKEDPTRCGVIVGSGVGGIQTIEAGMMVLMQKGPDRLNPFTVPRLMANAVSGDLSIRYNLQGPSDSHTTACASSGHSLGDAFNIIRRGEADVILAGGSEAAISPLCVGAFMTMRALSTRNDSPEEASRPFDRERDGFVLSEGAAVLILESEDHAKARGAEILGEILGYGATSDASHITAPHPEGSGAARAMRAALKDARLNPDQVDYINAHGTSTPLGDSAEVAAVHSVFGDYARKSKGGKLLMSSTKSMIGHCLGASGAVESIACLGTLQHGVITPTINCRNPDPEFDLDFVPESARDARVRVCLNNTFGFGGHNVSLVMAAYEG